MTNEKKSLEELLEECDTHIYKGYKCDKTNLSFLPSTETYIADKAMGDEYGTGKTRREAVENLLKKLKGGKA